MCYTEFGVKLKSEGNLKHGLDKIRKATKFCPNYAPAYFNMGVIFQDLREWNEVLFFFHGKKEGGKGRKNQKRRHRRRMS